MKLRKCIQPYQRFWVIGLITALFMASQIADTDAQALKSKISILGADDTFERNLSQPAQFLQRIGIIPEEIQKQLKARPRISVTGAGVVRNLKMSSFTSTQPTQSSIHVKGAGSARITGLTAFIELPNQHSLKPDILVVGAGSVRNVGLIAPTP